MAKKNGSSKNETPEPKAYSYEAFLEGCNIGAHKQLNITVSTSQKDLKILFDMGVKGIIKH